MMDLASEVVLRAGHLPSCGKGAEFPWDCTCDYAGFMDRVGALIQEAEGYRAAAGMCSGHAYGLCGCTCHNGELRRELARP